MLASADVDVRISTDDQFQFGIGIFLAGLQAQQPTPEHST
jgi:hypothetical protein